MDPSHLAALFESMLRNLVQKRANFLYEVIEIIGGIYQKASSADEAHALLLARVSENSDFAAFVLLGAQLTAFRMAAQNPPINPQTHSN